jgi:urease accessory protein
MWCERVLYNTQIPQGRISSHKAIDIVDIDWDECGNLLKSQTRLGEPVRVLLPSGERIRHGDVLAEDAETVVVVNVRPTQVIVAGPASTQRMAELALELGNLHLPTQVMENEIVFHEDASAMASLMRLCIPWRSDERRFEPTMISMGPRVRVSAEMHVLRRPQESRDEHASVRKVTSNA